MHRYHVSTNAGLDPLELIAGTIPKLDPDYWSRIAAIMECWRGKAIAVHVSLQSLRPLSDKASLRFPPRALMARRGSIGGCEKYIRACDEKSLRQSLGSICDEAARVVRRRKPLAARTPLQQGIDEQKGDDNEKLSKS